jgi:phenylacetate-coenzyme A ligase PaaK-like adenylate-forming protein
MLMASFSSSTVNKRISLGSTSSTRTTGKPSFVGITRPDAGVWTAITARSFYTQGLRKSDVVIHAAGHVRGWAFVEGRD